MRAYGQRPLAFVIAGATVLLSCRAFAQSVPATPERSAADAIERTATNATEDPEEITVRGRRTLARYRQEMEQAREELIEIFNEENSGKDNDVTCRDERPTGSRVPRRICRSDAQVRAESASARSMLSMFLFKQGNEGGSTAGAAEVRTGRSRTEIETELRRLAGENDKLFRAAVKYVDAEDAYDEAREGRRQAEADGP
jgi:hypothetical protein